MDNINVIHIIGCSKINTKPLAEIQDTEEFKNFSEKFGNAMKLNGIVYLINTGIEKETVRCCMHFSTKHNINLKLSKHWFYWKNN